MVPKLQCLAQILSLELLLIYSRFNRSLISRKSPEMFSNLLNYNYHFFLFLERIFHCCVKFMLFVTSGSTVTRSKSHHPHYDSMSVLPRNGVEKRVTFTFSKVYQVYFEYRYIFVHEKGCNKNIIMRNTRLWGPIVLIKFKLQNLVENRPLGICFSKVFS